MLHSKENPLNFKRAVKHLLLAGTIVILVLIAWGAISGGFQQFPRSRTVGQMTETILQVIAGLLSLTVVLTCFWGRRRARVVRIVWTVVVVAAVMLSSFVWGNAPPLTAVLLGVVSLFVVLGIRWALRVSLGS